MGTLLFVFAIVVFAIASSVWFDDGADRSEPRDWTRWFVSDRYPMLATIVMVPLGLVLIAAPVHWHGWFGAALLVALAGAATLRARRSPPKRSDANSPDPRRRARRRRRGR